MKILVWAYKYSPDAGVGGRRWRKLTKYLNSIGHDIWIVTPPEYFGNKINDENSIRIIQIGSISKKIHVFIHTKLSLYRFIYDRYLKYRIPKFFNHIDYAERWAKYAVSKVKDLINNNDIDILVATGHPCSINYFAALIKSEMPKIKLVQDFRDLWNSEYNYSIEYLKSPFAIKYKSIVAENISIQYADIVLNISYEQLNKMKYNHVNDKHKFKVLTNGFDPDDYLGVNNQDSKSLHLIHPGQIRWHSNKGVRELIYSLYDIEEELDKVNFSIDFYGTKYSKVEDKIAQYITKKYLNFHPTCHIETLAQKISSASFGLIIFDKDTGYSTKVFDYIALSKPFFSICPKGELSEFCLSHNMPTATYDRHEIKKVLLDMIGMLNNPPNSLELKEKYSLANLAKDCESLFLS